MGAWIPSSSRAVPCSRQLLTPCHLPLQELPYTKDVVEAGLAEDTHLYYMALIERGTGRCVSFPRRWQIAAA